MLPRSGAGGKRSLLAISTSSTGAVVEQFEIEVGGEGCKKCVVFVCRVHNIVSVRVYLQGICESRTVTRRKTLLANYLMKRDASSDQTRKR